MLFLGNFRERLTQLQLSFDPYLRKAVFNVVAKVHPRYVKDEADVPRRFWISIYGMPTIYKLISTSMGLLLSFINIF